MANRIMTYILAPTRDSAPDDLILLGNIIISPHSPEERLNEEIPISFMKDIQPSTSHKEGWKDSQGRHHNLSGGIFAQFLQMVGLGGDIDGGHDSRDQNQLFVEKMDTYYFYPTDAQINKSIKDPGVQRYLEKNHYHQPVFMITGLMIARGASAVQSSLKSHVFRTKIGIDLTAIGAPITVGPKFSMSGGRDRDLAWEKSSDFILAYRLTRIKIIRSGVFKYKKYNKGALYNSETAAVGDEENEELETLQTEWRDLSADDMEVGEVTYSDTEDGRLAVVSLPS